MHDGCSFSVDMSPLNIDRLQSWIDQGRLDPSKPITMKELNDSRCLHGVKDGVKLLARVRLTVDVYNDLQPSRRPLYHANTMDTGL